MLRRRLTSLILILAIVLSFSTTPYYAAFEPEYQLHLTVESSLSGFVTFKAQVLPELPPDQTIEVEFYNMSEDTAPAFVSVGRAFTDPATGIATLTTPITPGRSTAFCFAGIEATVVKSNYVDYEVYDIQDLIINSNFISGKFFPPIPPCDIKIYIVRGCDPEWFESVPAMDDGYFECTKELPEGVTSVYFEAQIGEQILRSVEYMVEK